MLAEATAVQADLIRLRVALRYMLHDLRQTGPETDAVKNFIRQTGLPGTWGSVSFQDWSEHPAADPWKRAREELTRAADAPLPARDGARASRAPRPRALRRGERPAGGVANNAGRPPPPNPVQLRRRRGV